MRRLTQMKTNRICVNPRNLRMMLIGGYSRLRTGAALVAG